MGLGSRPVDLFPNSGPPEAPTLLSAVSARGGQGIHRSPISEKSRSEFVVAPVLLAGPEISGDRFAIDPGQRLDVAPPKAWWTKCDFILTASDAVLPLRTPLAVVVEAKENDIEGGLGRCIAQMVAADQFNQSAAEPGARSSDASPRAKPGNSSD